MSLARIHNFSISLDGFGTGEGLSYDAYFGHAGDRLHEWMFATRFWEPGGSGGVDDAFAQQHGPGFGAEIMGAGKFGPPGWHEDPEWTGAWGPNPPFHTPTFILTHHPRPSVEMEGGTTYHFIDASPTEALETAREAAGGQDVRLGGGPTMIRDFLAAGLVDHMHFVVVPILLGRGVRLWDGLEGLEKDYDVEVTSSPSGVTHVTFTRGCLNPGGRAIVRWTGDESVVDSSSQRRANLREERAMPKVIADITMSLDGYVTGPGADPEHGLGDAPELHAWVTEQDRVDAEILEGATAASGAVVMGRRLFDTVDGPDGWSKDMGYGAQEVGTPPFFVLTHSPPQDVRLERELGMRFTFVADLEDAIDQARTAATDGDVVIMGGGDVIGQALESGIVDEFHVHLAPILLGGGTPLFRAGTRQRYRQRDVRPSSNAVHIAYERLTDE